MVPAKGTKSTKVNLMPRLQCNLAGGLRLAKLRFDLLAVLLRDECSYRQISR